MHACRVLRWRAAQEVSSLPSYCEFTATVGVALEAVFSASTTDAVHLLSRMLTLSPRSRITAAEVGGVGGGGSRARWVPHS